MQRVVWELGRLLGDGTPRAHGNIKVSIKISTSPTSLNGTRAINYFSPRVSTKYKLYFYHHIFFSEYKTWSFRLSASVFLLNYTTNLMQFLEIDKVIQEML